MDHRADFFVLAARNRPSLSLSLSLSLCASFCLFFVSLPFFLKTKHKEIRSVRESGQRLQNFCTCETFCACRTFFFVSISHHCCHCSVGAHLHITGSSVNGFGEELSDVDLCLLLADHDVCLMRRFSIRLIGDFLKSLFIHLPRRAGK